MGVVVQSGYGKPDVNDIRCVKEEYTVPGKLGSFLWHDRGSGANMNIRAWTIEAPDNIPLRDGEMFLLPGTVAAHRVSDYNQVYADPSLLNVFIIDLPVIFETDHSDMKPTISGPHSWMSKHPTFFSSVRVPFTLITDRREFATLAWQVNNSPFYYVGRVEEYTDVASVDNQTNSDAELTYTKSIGLSNSDSETFSYEIGLKIKVQGKATFPGGSASASVELSQKLGWTYSTSSTYSYIETRTYKKAVPPKTFIQLVQATGRFVVSDGWGREAATLPIESNKFVFLEYVYN